MKYFSGLKMSAEQCALSLDSTKDESYNRVVCTADILVENVK